MKKHLLKTMVAVLAIAAAAAGPVRGQNSSTVTFSSSDFPGTTEAAFQQTKGDITVAVSKGTATDLVRVFANETFTVSTSSGTLSSVAITCNASGTSKYGPGHFGSPTPGSYSYEGTVGTWTAPSGGAASFTLTASAQVRITSIEVTYTPAASGGSQPITCTLEDVGKVLCSDGSIYATASAASADSKTAVAMITYLDVTTHKGLAMSLTDVNAGTSFCSQTSVTCQANLYGNEDAALGDMDGLANTAALVAHTHNHSAANVAANYDVARPEGASAWFLPSAGQWDRMATAAGGYESLESELGLESDLYWSSSERNKYNAWAISFNSSQPLGNYTKTETHRVRACFEFDANIPVPHTVRFAAGNDGWMVTDVDSARSATAPAVLNGVMAGDSLVVTAPASLNRKVKGVKAVKYVPLSIATATAEHVGMVIGADGLLYSTTDAATAAGTTPVAIVAYVGTPGSVDASNASYRGLAIALSDANNNYTCNWDGEEGRSCLGSQTTDIATAIGFLNGIANTTTLTGDGHTHSAASVAVSNNGTAAPDGTSGWFLPSIGQWNLVLQSLASKKAGTAVTTNISKSTNDTFKASNLNSVITAAGGTGLLEYPYWSSTQYGSNGEAWVMVFDSGNVNDVWVENPAEVRAFFAF